jgi:hypothetical protein
MRPPDRSFQTGCDLSDLAEDMAHVLWDYLFQCGPRYAMDVYRVPDLTKTFYEQLNDYIDKNVSDLPGLMDRLEKAADRFLADSPLGQDNVLRAVRAGSIHRAIKDTLAPSRIQQISLLNCDDEEKRRLL